MNSVTVLIGDWVEQLKTLSSESVQCCVTSPPYWGLRNYSHPNQLGRESTPEEYVSKLVSGFEEVRRILKPDGTLWLNLGDTYSGGGNGGGGSFAAMNDMRNKNVAGRIGAIRKPANCKPKDLVGIPWMVAFALRSASWYLRCDIIWSKPNPMPESIKDRPTRAHEYIFLFSKSRRYFYDYEAIKDPPSPDLIKQIEDGCNGHAIKDYLGATVQDASATKSRIINGYRNKIDKQRGHGRRHNGFNDKWDALTPAEQGVCGRNKRSVWTIAPANFKDAHFATFPAKLIEPCVLAGSREGDIVLDPFAGSGTVGEVAAIHNRKSVLIELNPDYARMIERRCSIAVQIPLIKTKEDRLMTLEQRDQKLKLLEDILEKPRTDQNTVAINLCQVWIDGLWEVSDDSFEEFLANEFDMTQEDAFIIMKAAASAGHFPEDTVEKINEQFERLG